MKTMEPKPGSTIDSACDEAVRLAKQENCDVKFRFNDITLVATPQSDPVKLTAEYWAATNCGNRKRQVIVWYMAHRTEGGVLKGFSSGMAKFRIDPESSEDWNDCAKQIEQSSDGLVMFSMNVLHISE
jgi:hypothetical protein